MFQMPSCIISLQEGAFPSVIFAPTLCLIWLDVGVQHCREAASVLGYLGVCGVGSTGVRISLAWPSQQPWELFFLLHASCLALVLHNRVGERLGLDEDVAA